MAGIYIHIPFCKKKCIYCDFYSIGATAELEAAYVSALVKELRMRKSELRGEAVETLYFGGGTPSLLSPKHIAAITDALKNEVGLDALKEYTVEVNPDDVNEAYVGELAAIGVNRISMGIQSFVDAELHSINRRHSASDAIAAVENLRNGGIGNISIDLIYGLPGQTLDSWKYSLAKAVELGVQHISCYNLSYEEGTRLYSLRERGDISECSEELCIAMYEELVGRLAESGYEHYEVSNFAKDGMYSLHNSNYWNGSIYLGLGASAHSYDGTMRSYNVANARLYINEMESGRLACERELETDDERYDEYVMIRLRTKWGVDAESLLTAFGEKYHRHFLEEAQPYLKSGKMQISGTRYHLTESGVMLSDMIIRDLMI